MDVLVYVAISVGVLSGVWAWMAAVFEMCIRDRFN